MIIFAHGLEGTPNGSKIQTLRNSGIEVIAPDFQGMPLIERVELLEKISLDYADKKPILGGSSYGGLTAAIVAMKYPERFSGLLLCAPALHLKESPVDEITKLVAPKNVPTVIIHGIEDDIVPISCSIEYSQNSESIIKFNKVNDGHRLSNSHDFIIDGIKLIINNND